MGYKLGPKSKRGLLSVNIILFRGNTAFFHNLIGSTFFLKVQEIVVLLLMGGFIDWI